MTPKPWLAPLMLSGICTLSPVFSYAESAVEDLRKTVAAQQKAIDDIQRQLDAATTILENSGQQSNGADEPSSLDTQTSGTPETHIGGYGELHYNNLESKKELDFHRFVLFFGHDFSNTIRFHSEVELEHSVSSAEDVGEVELEQAFLEFDLSDRHTARAGSFLIPVGILNETHEPPTFYGVERNPVETYIIPSTWWEGGAGINGGLGPGWKYDFDITTGLNASTGGGNAYLVRNGRQQAAKATAENLAYTTRLRWTGLAGIELSGTLNYQEDVTQGAQSVSATLWEAHAVVRHGPFGLRTLYATWHLDGSGPKAVGRNEQTGWYVEPSFKVTVKTGVFARYNTWDSTAGDNVDSKSTQTSVGINYWPHEDVVVKTDIQHQGGVASDDGFNLGIGYQF